jgi:hypothetical protein
MRVVKSPKPTHAKQGGKSHKRLKRGEYDAIKTKAVNMVMRNVAEEAKKIEMEAVKQVLEKHLGRPLHQGDVAKVGRIALPNGYVLTYDLKPLGEIERHNSADPKAEDNYRITFTPYEDEHSETPS